MPIRVPVKGPPAYRIGVKIRLAACHEADVPQGHPDSSRAINHPATIFWSLLDQGHSEIVAVATSLYQTNPVRRARPALRNSSCRSPTAIARGVIPVRYYFRNTLDVSGQ